MKKKVEVIQANKNKMMEAIKGDKILELVTAIKSGVSKEFAKSLIAHTKLEVNQINEYLELPLDDGLVQFEPENIILNLYIEHFYLTETYDRTLPHYIHQRTGDAIVNAEYGYLSFDRASKLTREVDRLYSYFTEGDTKQEVNNARKQVYKMQYITIQQLYKILENKYLE